MISILEVRRWGMTWLETSDPRDVLPSEDWPDIYSPWLSANFLLLPAGPRLSCVVTPATGLGTTWIGWCCSSWTTSDGEGDELKEHVLQVNCLILLIVWEEQYNYKQKKLLLFIIQNFPQFFYQFDSKTQFFSGSQVPGSRDNYHHQPRPHHQGQGEEGECQGGYFPRLPIPVAGLPGLPGRWRRSLSRPELTSDRWTDNIQSLHQQYLPVLICQTEGWSGCLVSFW